MEVFKALYRNKLNIIDKYLDKGGDVNICDSDGRTLLMHSVLAEKIETTLFLLKRGALINLQDNQKKWTALHFAVQTQNANIVKILLESGANIEAIDIYGNTPLWRAVMSSKGKGDVIKILVNYGADKNKENFSRVSPCKLAKTISNYNIEKFLS